MRGGAQQLLRQFLSITAHPDRQDEVSRQFSGHNKKKLIKGVITKQRECLFATLTTILLNLPQIFISTSLARCTKYLSRADSNEGSTGKLPFCLPSAQSWTDVDDGHNTSLKSQRMGEDFAGSHSLSLGSESRGIIIVHPSREWKECEMAAAREKKRSVEMFGLGENKKTQMSSLQSRMPPLCAFHIPGGCPASKWDRVFHPYWNVNRVVSLHFLGNFLCNCYKICKFLQS